MPIGDPLSTGSVTRMTVRCTAVGQFSLSIQSRHPLSFCILNITFPPLYIRFLSPSLSLHPSVTSSNQSESHLNSSLEDLSQLPPSHYHTITICSRSLSQPTSTTSPYAIQPVIMSFKPVQSKPQKPTDSQENIRGAASSAGAVFF